MKLNIKLINWLPDEYFPAFLKSTLNDSYLQEFKLLIKGLNTELNEEHLKTGLCYFQKQYIERPYCYPGDFIYYKILKAAILKGLSQDKAFEKAKFIIDREMDLLDRTRALALALGLRYEENWQDY